MCEVLEKVRQVAANPYQYAAAWKKSTDQRILGYYPMDFPEEIFHAAGFFTFAIYGSKQSPYRADGFLQGFADSLSKSFLHHNLNGDLGFLDALVVTHIDDTTRVLSSICKDNLGLPLYEDFIPPKRFDTPLALIYLIEELRRLKEAVERFIGHPIQEESLRESIALHNRQRSLLRCLNTERFVRPGLISNRDFYDVVKTATVMPKEEHTRLLERLIDSLEVKGTPASGAGGRQPSLYPLLLTGYLAEPCELYDVIDNMNGLIVGDDIFPGSRYFSNDTPSEGGPIAAIADRYINQFPSPFYVSRESREKFLLRLFEERKAKGIIFVQIKFSETFNYDYPNLRQAFEERDIPCVCVETDLGMASLGQMKTYLQTFFETTAGY